MSKDKPMDKKNDTTVSMAKSQFEYFDEFRKKMQNEKCRDLTESEYHQCFLASVLSKDFDDHEVANAKSYMSGCPDIIGKMSHFDHGHNPDGGTSA